MNRSLLFLFLAALLYASAAFAVTIDSIIPASGPTTGGTEVIIKGSGFAEYLVRTPPGPPDVYFGGLPASVELIDSTTLRVRTPMHFPGTVGVIVDQGGNGTASRAEVFTFVGELPEEGFERLLLPVLTPPIHGAFGAEFHTDLRVANKPRAARVFLFGLDLACDAEACGPSVPNIPLWISTDAPIEPWRVAPNGTPGRFLYVPVHQAGDLAIHLRVLDVSRSALTFGTEMPVARERDFTDQLLFSGVPTDDRFRATLRLYGTAAAEVLVHVEGHGTEVVPLQPGRNLFEPAYAVFSHFPADASGDLRVTVSPAVAEQPPFRGFITVTNNETQWITTITPQP